MESIEQRNVANVTDKRRFALIILLLSLLLAWILKKKIYNRDHMVEKPLIDFVEI